MGQSEVSCLGTYKLASNPGSLFRMHEDCKGLAHLTRLITTPYLILSHSSKAARQNPEQRAWVRGYLQTLPVLVNVVLSCRSLKL